MLPAEFSVTSPNPRASLAAAHVFADAADFFIECRFFLVCAHRSAERGLGGLAVEQAFADAVRETARTPQAMLSWDGAPQLSFVDSVHVHALFRDTMLEFQSKSFDCLSLIEIRTRPQRGEVLRDQARLFKHALLLEGLAKNFNAPDSGYYIYLDDRNPPYCVSIATAMLDASGKPLGDADADAWQWVWTPEFVRHKRELVGRWSDFYVGGFPNYSDELWDSRVAQNLTNRLSELQLIRTNSMLVFMTGVEWAKHHAYMEEHVFLQTLQIRAVHLCFYLLNSELSRVQRLMITLDAGDLSTIQREIDRVHRFDDVMSTLIAGFYEALLINRRPHSKRILNTMIETLELTRVQDITATQMRRVKQRVRDANELALQLQTEKQKDSLNLINVILGSEVAVTLAAGLLEYYGGLSAMLSVVFPNSEPSFAQKTLALLLALALLGCMLFVGRRAWQYLARRQWRAAVRAKRDRALQKVRGIARWRVLGRALKAASKTGEVAAGPGLLAGGTGAASVARTAVLPATVAPTAAGPTTAAPATGAPTAAAPVASSDELVWSEDD